MNKIILYLFIVLILSAYLNFFRNNCIHKIEPLKNYSKKTIRKETRQAACANFEQIKSRMSNIDLQIGVTGSTEEKLLVKIAPFLDTKDSVSVDIGANQGLFSKLLKKIFVKEPRYIFDVIPLFVARLRRMFPSSVVKLAAVSDIKNKTVNILGASKWGKEFKQFAGASIIKRGELFKHVLTTVKTTTMDAFFVNKKNIFFLKIDTEGMDGRVLHGAKQMLKEKRIQSIFWENNKIQVFVGDSLYTNIQFLNSLGYTSFQVGRDILFPISDCRKDHIVFAHNAPTGNILSVDKQSDLYKFLKTIS